MFSLALTFICGESNSFVLPHSFLLSIITCDSLYLYNFIAISLFHLIAFNFLEINCLFGSFVIELSVYIFWKVIDCLIGCQIMMCLLNYLPSLMNCYSGSFSFPWILQNPIVIQTISSLTAFYFSIFLISNSNSN